jgi:AmmeMemoRadiSam system protein B
MSAETEAEPTGSRRRPAVAGRFYPADPDELRGTVDELLAEVWPVEDGLAKAYVVPHAGLRYSGTVAAEVYARLVAYQASVTTVLLLGPAHFVPLRGCAVPTTQRWATPLGDVTIASELARDLVAARHAGADDAPHAPEHSLEVQLPLLQRVLPDAAVLPVAVGQASPEEVAALITAAQRHDTLVICSTDLSHYLTQEAAIAADQETIAAILDRDPAGIGERSACGLYALRGLLTWARQVDAVPQLLAHRTSYDSTGDASRVVGYAAVALE